MTPAAAALVAMPRRRRYLVGVSGGRDSMALLHLLKELGFARLTVCHFDHELRGRESEKDAEFVRSVAEEWGYRFVLGATEVEAFAADRKWSIETAAREARYRFFKEAARQARCARIFLGHHADDRVETFFFNLLRGAGPAGLTGMQVVSRRGGLEIIRPMLGVWRAEIDTYVHEHELRYREDATNRSVKPSRGRLRHELIPQLSAGFGRDVRPALWRAAEVFAAEKEWLESLVPAPSEQLSARKLRAMPLGLQRRVLHAWLKHLEVPEVGFEEVERVRALLGGAAPAKVNLPGGRHARRRAGILFVESGTALEQ